MASLPSSVHYHLLVVILALPDCTLSAAEHTPILGLGINLHPHSPFSSKAYTLRDRPSGLFSHTSKSIEIFTLCHIFCLFRSALQLQFVISFRVPSPSTPSSILVMDLESAATAATPEPEASKTDPKPRGGIGNNQRWVDMHHFAIENAKALNGKTF
jgi:hypothetical protein